MTRLKNTEDKNGQQLVAIKDQGKRQLEALTSHGATNKSQKIEFRNEKNQEAKELVDEVSKISRENKYKKFVCLHSHGTPYDFNTFRDIKQRGNKTFNDHISIKQAKDDQNEMKEDITKL